MQISRLREIRGQLDKIYEDITAGKTPMVEVDNKRTTFFFTELDSLMMVLTLLEAKAYKECLIVLRTVFEKFLYFWLMLEGTRYRQTIRWTIKQLPGETLKQARDRVLQKWLSEYKAGYPAYHNVERIESGRRDDVINVTYQHEGLYFKDDKLRLGPTIPYYNFMLHEYKPRIKTLTALPTIIEGEMFPDIRKQHAEVQNEIYSKFFYFKSMVRNLMINNLITKEQSDQIIVHYNFLSYFVHPSRYSLDIWESLRTIYSYTKIFVEPILSELLFLYGAKLMHLYIKVIVEHYKKSNPNFDSMLYDRFISELAEMSKDLWFLDNEPSKYDRYYSHARKASRAFASGKSSSLDTQEENEKIIYYEDPYERLAKMRSLVK